MIHERPDLDASSFLPDFDESLNMMSRNLKESWPEKYTHVKNGKDFLYIRWRLLLNTYRAILVLVDQRTDDEPGNPLVFSTTPLVRTLYEELVTISLILQSFPDQMNFFNKTGYTELFNEREAIKRFYKNCPKWETRTQEIEKLMKAISKEFGLTREERENPRKEIQLWPTPGTALKKLRQQGAPSNLVNFLEFTNFWFYAELSMDAHTSFYSIAKRGAHFSDELATSAFGDSEKDFMLASSYTDFKRSVEWTTYILVLSILSELEAHFMFETPSLSKLDEFWTLFSKHSEMAEELYEMRYKDLLHQLRT